MRSDQKRPKKVPSDYPQMIFRVSSEEKARLYKLINKAVSLANRNLKGIHSKKVRKNDIIVDALLEGLSKLTKKLSA